MHKVGTKKALEQWERKIPEDGKPVKAEDAKEVKLLHMQVSVMDNGLERLTSCEKLSLSTNYIEKIACLGKMKHLKILSVARNHIKSLNGLEAVHDTLEELWISYNLVEKLKELRGMKKLKVLYMVSNEVRNIKEVDYLKDLDLQHLTMKGNPIQEACALEQKDQQKDLWQEKIASILTKLEKLDGEIIKRDLLTTEP